MIIPIMGRMSWKNPPFATLALILANCFIFFAFQLNDPEKTFEALTAYFNSGLASIEIPAYVEYTGDDEAAEGPGDLSEISWPGLERLRQMERDAQFMAALHHDGIITPEDPEYDKWKNLRSEHQRRMSSITSHRFGLIPAEANPVSFLSYMFLHGGTGHLIGNMIFLWMVGCILEMGCGRLLYTAGYLLVGILSALFYYLVHMESHVPMIGASGAISGLMGALTVLFGSTRIRVFFTTGFYFNYLRIPAIILLPFWIGKELFDFYLDSPAQVAYMAHAGGLMGGALLGFAAKPFLDDSRRAFFDPEKEDPAPQLLEEAIASMAQLEFEKARAVLERLLQSQPGHPEALRHLFTIDKQHPDRPEFHRSAEAYLQFLIKDRSDMPRTLSVFREYAGLAENIGIGPGLSARMAMMLLDAGAIEEGKNLAMELVKNDPGHNAAPAVLLRLIQALRRQGENREALPLEELLCSRYPSTPEARLAKQERVN